MKVDLETRNVTLFLYVDALNSDYLNSKEMPFLHNLSMRAHYCTLENVIGYSFAIQSSMLGGNYPEEHDHWMPYFYSPESSPTLFRAFGKLSSALVLEKVPRLRGLALEQLRRIFLKDGPPTNNIPSSIIGKFSIFPYYYMCELPFFYELKLYMDKKCNADLVYIGPPTLKYQLYPSILHHAANANREKSFVLAYDDKLDILGHRYGPRSPEYTSYVKFLDTALQSTYMKLKTKFGDRLNFVVFSDHGQSQRTFSFDILSALGTTRLKLGRDYLCFVDATLALFWFQTATASAKIPDFLRGLKIGTVLDENRKNIYRINFASKKFGDLVFVLKPGGTFFPNFFSPFGTLKGLHGYLPEDPVQKAFVVSDRSLSCNFTHVKDFRDFALNMSD